MSSVAGFDRHFFETLEQKIRRAEQSHIAKIWINAIAEMSWLPLRCTIAPIPLGS
ncbi:hypothetical protein ACIOD2_49720 [Amycolatopsis sp. NPDC088138]|uniref:hypothetical protein n=1 Tax=Amycolatopsis sp. NPDC088138 TaxID=3363938 RepID=UPI0038097BE1